MSLLDHYDRYEGNPDRQRKIMEIADQTLRETYTGGSLLRVGLYGLVLGAAVGLAVGWGVWS